MDFEQETTKQKHSSAAKYVVVWIALVVLTAVTFGVSRIHLGEWNVVAALGIASIKAALVVLIFMHLLQHHGAMRLTFAASIVFVAILTVLVVADLKTRFPLALPHEVPRSELPPLPKRH